MHLAPGVAACYRKVYSGLNYRLRAFAGGRWASHCRPVTIALLLTERCNSRCIHCDIWKNTGPEDGPAPEQWKQVLADLASWLGPVEVTITGGEALLKPYTPEIVRYGAAAGLWIEVLTHGYWADQRRMEDLALAGPGRITISVDGIGEAHNRIRGREDFWSLTGKSLDTLVRIRREHRLQYAIRLKTVVMELNLDGLTDVASYAAAHGMEVWYQAIEQNYNTPEDPLWYSHAATWPKDSARAVRAVEELIRLKQQGAPITTPFPQLAAMIPYFREPAATRVLVQAHSAHERRPVCTALTCLQIQANGDVKACSAMPAIGNIKHARISEIWRGRPRWWESGCCLEKRMG